MRPTAYYAPLVVSFIVSLITAVLTRSLDFGALAFLISTVFSYLGFFVFFYPLYVFLDKKNKLNILAFLITGLIGGMLVYLLFGFLLRSILGSTVEVSVGEFIVGATLGTLITFVFCYFAGIRNAFPEKTE